MRTPASFPKRRRPWVRAAGSAPRRHRDRGSLGADSRGVETIEFALVGFAFFLMLFAIFELGRLASAESALTYGTGVAARYAAVHGSTLSSASGTAAVAAQFASAVAPVLGQAAPVPSVSVAPNDDPGSTVTVAAQYTWSPVSGGSSFASVVLSARSALVIEH